MFPTKTSRKSKVLYPSSLIFGGEFNPGLVPLSFAEKDQGFVLPVVSS